MSETVAKILSATTAQALADRSKCIQVYKNGSDYYTYEDVAIANLDPSEYTTVTISQTVIDSTSPVTPLRKIFPK